MFVRIIFTLWALLSFSLGTQAQQLTTLANTTLNLQAPGYTQLTFFDIWGNYGEAGPDELWAKLPDAFKAQVNQHIFIQPEFNVTEAQLREYQTAYPQCAPLVFDHSQTLLRQYHLWQLPAQVLLNQGKIVFAGNHRDFVQFIQQNLLTTKPKNTSTLTKE